MSELLKRITNLEEIGKGTIQTVYRDNSYVYKVFDTCRFNLEPEQVCRDVKEYYESCRSAGVVVPEESAIPYCTDGTVVANRYSYEGVPFTNQVTVDEFGPLYGQLLENVDKGTRHGLGLSPYHEQFVVGSRGLVFVDFLVPATKGTFRRYKHGEDAKNYYAVQFSRKSTFLSAYTSYLRSFTGKESSIRANFEDFIQSIKLDLFKKPADRDWLEWYLANVDNLHNEKADWLMINEKAVAGRAHVIEDVAKRSNVSDVIVFQKRDRIFSKEEIQRRLTEFGK